MNHLLWVLQALAALLFGASGVMKVFLLDQIRKDQPSFDALPRRVWIGLGVLELVCVALLIVPSLLRWRPALSGWAAAVLALETLVFVWVHVQYRDFGTMVMAGVLGLLMAFLAYGRLVLHPIA